MNERPGNSIVGAIPSGNAEASDPTASAARRADEHEERMIDESVDQSFPASDPPTSSQPGNIVWKRYAAKEARRRSRATTMRWLGLAIVAAGVTCAAVLLAKRSRRSSR
jgi:hypothetical protein